MQAQLAQEQFYEADILYGPQFDSVDWEMVNGALHWVLGVITVRKENISRLVAEYLVGGFMR